MHTAPKCLLASTYCLCPKWRGNLSSLGKALAGGGGGGGRDSDGDGDVETLGTIAGSDRALCLNQRIDKMIVVRIYWVMSPVNVEVISLRLVMLPRPRRKTQFLFSTSLNVYCT